MKIDAFSHVLPATYRNEMLSSDRGGDIWDYLREMWQKTEALHNMSARQESMEETGVDKQVLTLAIPPVEWLGSKDEASRVASLANDGVADIVRDHPTKFIGVATVSLLDPEAAALELTRSIADLGLVGVLLHTNVAGQPLDAEQFDEFFGVAEQLNAPIWLHPFRPARWADYPTEDESQYLMWYAFGWPMDTTNALARLVFGGVMARHPRLKVIAHHAGALIPTLANRITTIYRKEWMAGPEFAPGVEPPYVDRFREFYVDTVVTTGGAAALQRPLEFFGADHVLFGTDAPFGLRNGSELTEHAIRAVSDLSLTADERANIWSGNLMGLLEAR